MNSRDEQSLVLGIDAAWTASQPSGVALIHSDGEGARLLAVAASYDRFVDGERADFSPARGSPAPVSDLVRTAEQIAGRPVDLIAVDMPLSHAPISGRRSADDEISKAFGSRWCSTHSPTPARPGPISAALWKELSAAGYPLLSEPQQLGTAPGTIEVYPNVALLQMLPSERRVPYKSGNTRRYWPRLPAADRLERLRIEWHLVYQCLAHLMDVDALPVPRFESFAALKPYEDALDAVISAWVGVCFLRSRAAPFGDRDAAIWVPC